MEEGPPAPGLMPVRGSAPDPAGAAPLRPALKSKTFLKGENTLPKMLANLTPLPPPKSQIRKEALRRSFAPPSGSSFDYKMLWPWRKPENPFFLAPLLHPPGNRQWKPDCRYP